MKQEITWICIALLAALPAFAAQPNVHPGQWEATIKTEMPGMPMAIPPVTQRYCLRAEDLVPKTQDPGQECQLLEHTVDGDTVTWRVKCDSQGMKTSGTGKITYAGDTYKGRIDMTMQQGDAPAMSMIQTLEGRRVGECK